MVEELEFRKYHSIGEGDGDGVLWRLICECSYSALLERRRRAGAPWNSVEARRAARQARSRDLRLAGGASPKLLNHGGDGTTTVPVIESSASEEDFFQRNARTSAPGSCDDGSLAPA